jgi:hypothetical protein
MCSSGFAKRRRHTGTILNLIIEPMRAAKGRHKTDIHSQKEDSFIRSLDRLQKQMTTYSPRNADSCI